MSGLGQLHKAEMLGYYRNMLGYYRKMLGYYRKMLGYYRKMSINAIRT